jgi:hypothetical protein
MDRVRFARQLILPEIGEAGQQALVQSSVALPDAGLTGEVARRYAKRAGVPTIVASPTPPTAVPEWLQNPQCKQMVAGSIAACCAIMNVVKQAKEHR